jgi:hypothetical protein
MGGFNLPKGFQDDPEAILRRARGSLTPPQGTLPPIHPTHPQTNPVCSEIPTELVLSEPPPKVSIHHSIIASTRFDATVKAICNYSFPTISNVAIGPNVLSGKE